MNTSKAQLPWCVSPFSAQGGAPTVSDPGLQPPLTGISHSLFMIPMTLIDNNSTRGKHPYNG